MQPRKQVRPVLRRDLLVVPQQHQGRRCYVVKDPVTLRYYRFQESEHFILKTTARDSFLAPYALEALEKAYANIGKKFEVFPREKIRVEIYPTQDAFSQASTCRPEAGSSSPSAQACSTSRLGARDSSPFDQIMRLSTGTGTPAVSAGRRRAGS